MEEKKLFLLDAFALIYRAYFAFAKNPRYNSKGLNTSAILGFTNSLVEVLQKEKPTHIAVVFDTAGPTERHTDFTEYKANRQEQPEDITLSIPYIMRIIEGFNIPVLLSKGYEADDIIGTLAKKAEQADFKTFMMTPDKDFGQLVSDKTFIYKPARMGNDVEIMGVAEVCKKFEISEPKQVIDILGLMGDAVDNIPGVPGVGEKTAKKLIQEFGSIENLLQNTSKLKGALKEKVEANVDKAILSKKLATILIDAPVPFDEQQLKTEEPNKEVLKEIFAEPEFRTIGRRILGEDIPVVNSAPPKPQSMQGDLFASFDEASANGEALEDVQIKEYRNIQNVPHEYSIADTPEKVQGLLVMLSGLNGFCFDTETTSLNAWDCDLVGMSFSWEEHKGYYVPVPEDSREGEALLKLFKPIFENEQIEKTGQNLKYDITVLKMHGIEVKGKLFDTMLAHYLLEPDMKHGMDFLAETYLDYSPVSIGTLIGKKGKGQLTMRDVPVSEVAEYAAEDADVTFQLRQVFEPKLKETETHKLFGEIEVPLINVLSDM
jgi:DNA polymerase I